MNRLESDFRVGEWVVHVRLNTLSRGSKSVQIEPKVMRVLTLLAARRGDVLSKDEIKDEVWVGTFVTDEVLWRCISILRDIFGDKTRIPRFIQTVPKNGYRLIAPVSGLNPSCECRNLDGPMGATAAELISSIAVLPFVDLSPEKNGECCGDSIADELTNLLTQVKGLRVAARDSAFKFKMRDEDIKAIGNHLGVRTVLSGSVRRLGDRLRATVQLICVKDGCNIWSQQYEFGMSDPFAVHDEISKAVVEKLLSAKTVNFKASA